MASRAVVPCCAWWAADPPYGVCHVPSSLAVDLRAGTPMDMQVDKARHEDASAQICQLADTRRRA